MSKNQKVTEVAKPENKIQHQIAKWVLNGFGKNQEQPKKVDHIKSPIAIIVYSQSIHNHFSKLNENDTKHALKFAHIKKSMETELGFRVLQNEALFVDENLFAHINALIDNYVNTHKFSLFLVDHGGPGWFFAPDNYYYQEKIGFRWDFNEETLTHSYFILDENEMYFYDYETNEYYLIQLSNDRLNKVKQYFDISCKNRSYPKNTIDELSKNEIESLKKIINNDFSNEHSFRAKDLIYAEHAFAKVFSKIIIMLEKKLGITFTSIHLHSCNSAAEFINAESKDIIISSARILSTFLVNHYIFGNIGYNSDTKSTHLHLKENQQLKECAPSLEQTIVVFKNNKVVLKPKKEYFGLLNQLGPLTKSIFSDQQEKIIPYVYFDNKPTSSILSKFGLYGVRNCLNGLNKFYDTSSLIPN